MFLQIYTISLNVNLFVYQCLGVHFGWIGETELAHIYLYIWTAYAHAELLMAA